MVQCEKCGSKWEASSAYSKSLSVCPFCGAMLLEEEKARGYGKMDEFLGYMVKVYGEELYRNPERLKNLIGDLYGGEERVKRLFRRALIEDKLSVKVYEIAQKPENERQPFYNRLASQFAEGNYFSLELSLKVVGSLVTGLTGEVLDGAGLGQDAGNANTQRGKSPRGQGQTDTAKTVPQPATQNRIVQVGNVQFEMVHVEGGTFRMGATKEQGDARNNERPVHPVTLSSYLIGKHEVTQALWEEVMRSNPGYIEREDYPVGWVSWNDCQEFIEKLNARTGMKFRLPTEAEWEYAARGGNKSKGYKYAGSDNLDEVGWYDENSGCHTHPVGEKKPNELGLYDMSGNLYEWCQDWGGVYINEAQTNPTGRQSGVLRVLRGGSRWGSARSCRVSNRYYGDPGSRYDNNRGLRLVLSL